MTDTWENAVRRLDQTTARLNACAPDDFARLSQVLAERQQAVEELAALASEQPAAASLAVLDRLAAAAAAGGELARRLRLESAALRGQLAEQTTRARMVGSFAPGIASRRRRLNVRS